MRKHRILFISEAVTLAHISRPYVLACSLDEHFFEIHFACADFKDLVFKRNFYKHWPIKSISQTTFMDNLANCRPTHSFENLQEYVKEDLKLLENSKPDIVIGDFRLSLSVSARLANIPYVNITNAHWSPGFAIDRPVYDHKLFNLLGHHFGRFLFSLSESTISKMMANPLNKIRVVYGLKKYHNLFEAYTDGDITLFCDTPQLVPLNSVNSCQHYIGPVHWSPETDLTAWAVQDNTAIPRIFISLGSSGNQTLLPNLISLLSTLPVSIVVATAGQISFSNKPSNVFISDFLPGDLCCKRSDLVITNGGSGMSYQALKYGIPVIGLTSNYDQMLCMECIKKAGAGFYFKANHFHNDMLLNQVIDILFHDKCKTEALEKKKEFECFDSQSIFRKIIQKM